MKFYMVRREPGAGVENSFDILIDSDAFVGWFYEQDSHHTKTTKIFETFKQKRLVLATTDLIIVETATVLSHRKGQALARLFLDLADKYPVIHINENLHQEALTLFKGQKVKGTSVVDCANVVAMRHFKIPTIFSFDKFYSKHPDIQIATSVYP